MSIEAIPPTVVSFGPSQVDLRTQELKKHDVRLRLPGQSFQILAMLLRQPGDLVTREELQQALWPADTHVDFERGVNAAVNRLRDVLGDSADNPTFIETLPRRGYRFIAPVQKPAIQAIQEANAQQATLEQNPISSANIPLTPALPKNHTVRNIAVVPSSTASAGCRSPAPPARSSANTFFPAGMYPHCQRLLPPLSVAVCGATTWKCCGCIIITQ